MMRVIPKDYLKAYPVTHRFSSVDGIRTHWVERGAGPPLVGLHGLGGAWTDYWSLLPALMGRHAYLLDLPGCGKTDALGERLTIKTNADWLENWAVQQNIKPFVLESICSSAPIAIEFARRHPGKVTGLIFHMPVLSGGWLNASTHILYRILLPMPKFVHLLFHEGPLSLTRAVIVGKEKSIPESALLDKENKKKASRRVYSEFLNDILSSNWIADYKRLNAPTISLAMTEDSTVPFGRLKEVSKGKLVVDVGKWHSWNEEIIKAQNSAVQQFLARLK